MASVFSPENVNRVNPVLDSVAVETPQGVVTLRRGEVKKVGNITLYCDYNGNVKKIQNKRVKRGKKKITKKVVTEVPSTPIETEPTPPQQPQPFRMFNDEARIACANGKCYDKYGNSVNTENYDFSVRPTMSRAGADAFNKLTAMYNANDLKARNSRNQIDVADIMADPRTRELASDYMSANPQMDWQQALNTAVANVAYENENNALGTQVYSTNVNPAEQVSADRMAVLQAEQGNNYNAPVSPVINQPVGTIQDFAYKNGRIVGNAGGVGFNINPPDLYSVGNLMQSQNPYLNAINNQVASMNIDNTSYKNNVDALKTAGTWNNQNVDNELNRAKQADQAIKNRYYYLDLLRKMSSKEKKSDPTNSSVLPTNNINDPNSLFNVLNKGK